MRPVGPLSGPRSAVFDPVSVDPSSLAAGFVPGHSEAGFPGAADGELFRPVGAEVVGSAEAGPGAVPILAAAPDPDLVLVLAGWGYHGLGACDLGDQPRVVIARAVLRLIVLYGERELLPVRVGCGRWVPLDQDVQRVYLPELGYGFPHLLGGGGNVPHPYDHVDGGPGASSVLVGAVNPGLVLVVPVLVRRVFEVRRGAEREVRFSPECPEAWKCPESTAVALGQSS